MQEGSGLVTTGAPQACDDAWELLLHDQANWFVPQAPAADVQKEGEYVERQASNTFPGHIKRAALDIPRQSSNRQAIMEDLLPLGLPEAAPACRSSHIQWPDDIQPGGPHNGSFNAHEQHSADFPSVRITFAHGKAIAPAEKRRSSESRRSRDQSSSPSETAQAVPIPPRRSESGSTPVVTMSNSAPAPEISHSDGSPEGDNVPFIRPTIQTGIQTSASAPSGSGPTGGRRVLRTAEERKAHRMAKNRATAAASRKRKQVLHEDLLVRQEQLEQENAQLADLLTRREGEIAAMREQLAVAELVVSSGPHSLPCTTAGSPEICLGMHDMAQWPV